MDARDRHLIIVVEESDSSIGFYDSSNGSEVARVAVGHWPHEIELDRNGEIAYVTNLESRTMTSRSDGPARAFHASIF
jgi:hypothetical protein